MPTPRSSTALDDKSANRHVTGGAGPHPGQRSLADLPEFRGDLHRGRRDELAARALERAMVYDEDNPRSHCSWPRPGSEAPQGRSGLDPGRSARSSASPRGRKAYELLSKVLTALGGERRSRPAWKRPRNATARTSRSSTSSPTVTGKRARSTRAEALYKALLATPPTQQTYKAWPLRS